MIMVDQQQGKEELQTEKETQSSQSKGQHCGTGISWKDVGDKRIGKCLISNT